MRILLFCIICALSLPIRAQFDPPPLEQLSKLDFLVGKWEGVGRMRMGPGEPHEVRVVETVQPKAGGAVILIEGVGRIGTPGGADERTVHNALAIISYDTSAERFRMRAYRGDGKHIDADVVVEENKVIWSFDSPEARGTIRYIIVLNDKGQWHEIGEMTPDNGNTWHQFFEMTLDRRSDD